MPKIRRNYSLKINSVRELIILLKATDNSREDEKINSKNELNPETEDIRREIITRRESPRRDLDGDENNRLKNSNKSISDDALIGATGAGIR